MSARESPQIVLYLSDIGLKQTIPLCLPIYDLNTFILYAVGFNKKLKNDEKKSPLLKTN